MDLGSKAEKDRTARWAGPECSGLKGQELGVGARGRPDLHSWSPSAQKEQDRGRGHSPETGLPGDRWGQCMQWGQHHSGREAGHQPQSI